VATAGPRRLRWQVVAEGLAFPEGPVALADGSLLVSEMAAGRVSRVRPDGSVSLVSTTGGGPNGLALLPDRSLAVCQSGGSGWSTRPWPYDGPGSVPLFLPTGPADDPVVPQVQRIDRDGTVATLFAEDEAGTPLKKPSDLAIDRDGGIYLTDFGGLQGRTRSIAGVLYAPPGGPPHEIVYPVELANGIALAPEQDALYVTETRTRRLWRFELDAPGIVRSWRSVTTIPAGGPIGFGSADGCATDAVGNIVVATIGLGGATVVSPAGEVLAAGPVQDDPMPTNVAFGGPDGTTLYLTCGSTGRVLATDDWDVPGSLPPVDLDASGP
jgi:gluconolactonase